MTHSTKENKSFETEALRVRDVIGGQTLQPVEEENSDFEERIRRDDGVSIQGVDEVTKREGTNQSPTLIPIGDKFQCSIKENEQSRGRRIECTSEKSSSVNYSKDKEVKEVMNAKEDTDPIRSTDRSPFKKPRGEYFND